MAEIEKLDFELLPQIAMAHNENRVIEVMFFMFEDRRNKKVVRAQVLPIVRMTSENGEQFKTIRRHVKDTKEFTLVVPTSIHAMSTVIKRIESGSEKKVNVSLKAYDCLSEYGLKFGDKMIQKYRLE